MPEPTPAPTKAPGPSHIVVMRDGIEHVLDVDEEAQWLAQRAADTPSVAQLAADLVLRIDADADAIRRAVMGSRATEYQTTLSHAQAFRDAGYVGTPPEYVASWLDAKNAVGAAWTAQQAADDILDTAALWTGAEAQIRRQRLLRKEQARIAADAAAVADIAAGWAAFCAALRVQLGV
jgi:hypothetical protein